LAEKGTITEAVKGEIRGRAQRNHGKVERPQWIANVIVEGDYRAASGEARAFLGRWMRFCQTSTILLAEQHPLRWTITEIATATKRARKRFVGFAFFLILCRVMKLVEVVRTIATEPAVYEEMVAVRSEKLGQGRRCARRRTAPASS